MDITVTDVISTIRLQNSPVGVKAYRKNRERWGLALKLRGKTYYTVGERQILSDGNHPVLLPKGSSYAWTCAEPGECLIIEFDAKETCDTVLPFAVSDNRSILRGYGKLENLLSRKEADWEMECRYLVYELLLHLVRGKNREYVSRDRQKRIEPAMEYMTVHYYDGSITNEFLADLCGISTVYFRKLFESTYGVPPIRWLNSFRMDRACSMLESDYHSISQIAESVGCGSIYHFSKMFRAHTGVSPTEYAKQRKGKTR